MAKNTSDEGNQTIDDTEDQSGSVDKQPALMDFINAATASETQTDRVIGIFSNVAELIDFEVRLNYSCPVIEKADFNAIKLQDGSMIEVLGV